MPLQRLVFIAFSFKLKLLFKEESVLLLKGIIKFADISNSSRSWSVCERWANEITTEFFLQGDQERELKIQISPFMVSW